KKLKETTQTVLVRTIDHPVIQALQDEGVVFQSFDTIYETNGQFQDVYEQIAKELMEHSVEHDVVYAVPGHPMLAEKTVQLLLAKEDVTVEVLGGQSYLDALFTTLKIDPIDGFQFVDGTSFQRDQLDYQHHLVFC